ncbi:hypothetical protein CLIM01_13319 [Colletotrichum limetticola]|uniref:Uncharacterized protein n=1 Tax=Colletotrichum limetticola TaxID=1209924 RepID=A0ABQ9PDU9_9PEZI|nr:hypothetical protein CLIM01_13319 [Colletotrichum limetticola]
MIHGMKKGTPVAQQRLCPDGGTRDSAKASINEQLAPQAHTAQSKFGRPPISFSDTLHPSFSLAFCYALLSLQASHPLHPLGHFYLQRDPVDLQE